jgi:hypothetical protein
MESVQEYQGAQSFCAIHEAGGSDEKETARAEQRQQEHGFWKGKGSQVKSDRPITNSVRDAEQHF